MSNRVGGRKGNEPAQLDTLLDRYAERHKRCLFDESYQGQYIIVGMGVSFSGLGNRMLSVVTGMLLALMTDRCFFLRHDTCHRESKTPDIWTCGDPLYITGNFTDLWATHDVIDFHHDDDYLVPLLLSNPHYRRFFDRYFPGREVFNPLSRFMFRLHPRTEAAAQQFRKANFGVLTVGLQVRTQKPLGPGVPDPAVSHICTLARTVQLKQGLPDDQIQFFVATDSERALAEIKRTLGPERVVSMYGGAKEGVKRRRGQVTPVRKSRRCLTCDY
ncbi:g5237 [Coccomyxa elongata]